MPKIGPTGQYEFGSPRFPGDRGGLFAGFKVLPQKRQCLLAFGSAVNVLACSKREANHTARMMRQSIISHFGPLAYNKAELPIRLEAKPEIGAVMVQMPVAMAALVANPEAFLAFAERLEEEAAKLHIM